MNKVAKEQLGLFKPKKIEVPEFNLESRDYLHSVLGSTANPYGDASPRISAEKRTKKLGKIWWIS